MTLEMIEMERYNEGLKEGLTLEREEGRKEGREEGRKEGRKQILYQFISTMLKKGNSVKMIAECFNLNVDEVLKIADAMEWASRNKG